MHIAYVIAPAGGPEANVKTLAPELERHGHRISVIYTVAKEKVDSTWSDSIRFRFAPAPSAHYYAAKVVGSFHAWPLRLRAWEQGQAVRKELNQIQSEEPIDIVEVTEGFSVSALGRRWCVVVRAHGSDWTFRQFCGDPGEKADEWLAAHQRRQFSKAHFVTALSKHLSTYLNETLQLSNEIEPLPYGIDTRAFAPNSHTADSPPVLLTVGRLERRKGVDVLLRAMPEVWRRFPDTQVRLIGGESDLTRSELLEMVPAEKRSQITFPGFLSRDQLVSEYQHATIYVAPTQYETFGYTVLEAMACGRPVVSTHVGAIPELVDAETGVLVPSGDAQALAESIVELLDEPEKREKMGNRGRQKAISRFSTAKIVEKTIAVYSDALSLAIA